MESELIDWLGEHVRNHPQLRLGIGDDAAILQLAADASCVVTTDTLTDGVHFELTQVDPRRAGRKALAVNLSDLAAMAARPLAATVSLVLPRQGGHQLGIQLLEGVLSLAEQFETAIAGGDTNSWDGPLVISITAIGEQVESRGWIRSGAQVNDQVLVTGSFGGSILGKHLDFQPRVRQALQLRAGYEVHAAIDVSDGLSLDMDRLSQASGCGILVDLDAIPISPEAHCLAGEDTGRSALEHALSDGEDFELVLALPPDQARRLLDNPPLDVPLTRIGHCIPEPGLWQLEGGVRQPLQVSGYQHRSTG